MSPINATTVNVMWDEPAKPGGMIVNYVIVISQFSAVINHTDTSNLTLSLYGLTFNTDYTINISAVNFMQGDVASMSFTTPSCKCVIVLMCYVMYCFD